MKLLRKLLAMLPAIEVGMDDWHLHVSVGERRTGFTVGPHFLSFDDKNDIRVQVISPPKGYEAPLSDITFSWSSREGLIDLNIPAYKVGDYTPHAGMCEEEEPIPSTVREIPPMRPDCRECAHYYPGRCNTHKRAADDAMHDRIATEYEVGYFRSAHDHVR